MHWPRSPVAPAGGAAERTSHREYCPATLNLECTTIHDGVWPRSMGEGGMTGGWFILGSAEAN